MKYFEIPIDIKAAGCIGTPGHVPVLQSYLLDGCEEIASSHKRAAVLICPGGAYQRRSVREGEPIAMRFLAQGMQAFVLQYSTDKAKFPCALVELAASVSYLKEHAKDWNIDEARIFLCGFSAGGHLCASLGTLHHHEFLKEIMCSKLGILEGSWRPAGMILSYPVISGGKYTHEESRQNLIGAEADETLSELISMEKQISKQTIPVFLWHTQEDQTVPVENSLLFAAALRKEGIPFELHVYEKGEHGLSLCDEVTAKSASQVQPDSSGWVDLAIKWIQRR